ncbi:hypothetical protein WH47_04499 [Habropoda laboriosa]|uniref:Uncharacterized protein n=1 Tax=Habropoda laboriosa TaxID=597456 RepID=A0A0L7R212_9HYME|nr:hypothetical protein WH47_04499 [Habropoda laboriosa]
MHCAATSSLGTTTQPTARLDFQDRIAGCCTPYNRGMSFPSLQIVSQEHLFAVFSRMA